MRTVRGAALAALALVALAVGSARAGGFPGLDESRETVLVGPGVSGVGDAVGSWQVAPGRVAPMGGKKGSHASWLAREGEVGDGFVRARIVASKGAVDAAVLLRATLPDVAAGDPTGAVSGYAVVMGDGEVRLERWDRGQKRLLEPAEKVRVRGGVEVLAWLIGPQLRIDVYDAATLGLLASFAASDPQLPLGRVGMYASGAGAESQALVLLALARARVKGAAREVPAGPQRYLEVATASLDLLAPEARAAVKIVERREGDAVVVRASAAGHELLRRLERPVTWLGSDTPFKYVDPSYLAAAGRAPIRTESGFRIDDSYKDPAMVEALLVAYHQRFPSLTRLVELGRTTSGRHILGLVVSDRAAERERDEPAILLDGAHHGNELMPVDNVLDAVQVLLEQYDTDRDVRALVDGLEIWCVPLVNPDGNFAFWHYSSQAGRKNVRDTDRNGRFDATDGVDLNRNYPFRWGALGEAASRSFARNEYFRGPAPASEPESRALMRLSDSEHFAASISYHTVSNVILVPYTTDGPRNPEPNEAWVVAEQIAKALPKQPTGKRMGVAKKIYAVDGVDQDHFRASHGTVALLVEGPYHNPLAKKTRAATLASTRGTWRVLLERVLRGPRVSGHVTDGAGKPLQAEVVVREQRPLNGEVWTSRCRDGRFDRVLAGPGRYTLEVRAPGYVAVTRTVTAGREPVTLKVQLEAGAGAHAEPLCGDPALASIDAWCACRTGACVEPGPPRWCRIDGACVVDGAAAPDGRGHCRASASQVAWSLER